MFNLSKMKFMFCVFVLLAVFPALTSAATAVNASQLAARQSNRAAVTPKPHWSQYDFPTFTLIEHAFENGEITAEQRILYLTYALYEEDSLPLRYRSDIPWQEDLSLYAQEVSWYVRSDKVCSFGSFTQSELRRILGEIVTPCDNSNRKALLTTLFVFCVLAVGILIGKKKILSFIQLYVKQ